MEAIDDPERLDAIEATIQRKPALRRFYENTYARFVACVARSAPGGRVVELGSGGGFLKDVLPDVVTTDVIPYASVDRVIDATAMEFDDQSVSTLLMLNVFHHINDAAAFLREADRVLVPGGRLLVADQFPGLFSRWIYQYVHHEAFDMRAERWSFPSGGPLSSANGALPWIVFVRDRNRLAREFPSLQIDRFEPHTPLWYWLSGGLKRWSALPTPLFQPVARLEQRLLSVSPRMASFVDVELVKRPNGESDGRTPIT